MHVPSRALPWTFLALSLASIAVIFAAPWIGVGSETREAQWTWSDALFSEFGSNLPQPHLWALAGAAVGAGASLAWIALVRVLPEAGWTPGREAALASLQAPAMFFIASAGGMGVGFSVLAAEGRAWAVSPAGIALLVLAGLGTILLAVALFARLAARRTAVFLLLGVLVAGALFHAVPWLTATQASEFGEGEETSHLVRAVFQIYGGDPLSPLDAALVTILFGALAWTLAVALLPAVPQRDAFVDASFSLAAFVPLGLAAVAVGRMVGAWLGGYEAFFAGEIPGALGDEEALVYATNAYVFLALLLAATALVATTLSRTSRALDEGWSP